MPLSMLPYRRVTPISNLRKYLSNIFSNNIDYITLLQKQFIKKYNKKYALTTSSGRQAMELIIKSFNFPPNSEIIFPCLTFFRLPQIIKELYLKPVFINCNNYYQMDIKELKNKITKNTKAIIATHLFGSGCAIDKIRQIAKKNNLIVIEDCAHVPGVRYKNKLLGTYGDAAFFSFQNRKHINSFGGGMLLTNNKKIAEFAISEINKQKNSKISIIPKLFIYYLELIITNKYIYRFFAVLLRSNFYRKYLINLYHYIHHKNVEKRKKYTNFQAKIAYEQFQSIDRINQIKIALGNRYNKYLKNNKCFIIPPKQNNNYYSYVINHKNAKTISRLLFKKGIDTGYGENIIMNCGKLFSGSKFFRKTDKLLSNSLELPIYFSLKAKDLNFIIKNMQKSLNV